MPIGILIIAGLIFVCGMWVGSGIQKKKISKINKTSPENQYEEGNEQIKKEETISKDIKNDKIIEANGKTIASRGNLTFEAQLRSMLRSSEKDKQKKQAAEAGEITNEKIKKTAIPWFLVGAALSDLHDAHLKARNRENKKRNNNH